MVVGNENIITLNSDYFNTEIINNGINNIINKEQNNQIYKNKNNIYKKVIINKNNLLHYSNLNSNIPFQRKRNYSTFQINNFPNYNNYNIIFNNKNYETEKINNINFEEEEKENILNKDDLKYIGFSQEKNYINEKNEKLNILHIHLESVDYNRKSYNFIKEKKLKFLDNILYKDLIHSKLSKYKSCIICKNNFNESDIVNIFYCGEHIFHKICLQKWLIQSNNCPFCNYDFMKY